MSIQSFLHGMLDLYPYKIQAHHELLPENTNSKQTSPKRALAPMGHKPQWLLKVMWIDKPYFSMYVS